MSAFFNDLIEILNILLVGILVVGFYLIKFFFIPSRHEMRRTAENEYKEKKETQQSLEELAYDHSRYYPYILEMIPEAIRLHLSKYRGNRKALAWRIKLLQLHGAIDPEAAKMLMEEYMITQGRPSRPVPMDSWACPKCGAYNEDTALFCKDCGDYK